MDSPPAQKNSGRCREAISRGSTVSFFFLLLILGQSQLLKILFHLLEWTKIQLLTFKMVCTFGFCF